MKGSYIPWKSRTTPARSHLNITFTAVFCPSLFSSTTALRCCLEAFHPPGLSFRGLSSSANTRHSSTNQLARTCREAEHDLWEGDATSRRPRHNMQEPRREERGADTDIKLKWEEQEKRGRPPFAFLPIPIGCFYGVLITAACTHLKCNIWHLGFQVQDSGLPLTHLGFANQPFLLEALEHAEQQV